jgi:hypothetical protein
MVDVAGLRGGLHPIFLGNHPWVGVLVLALIIGVVLYKNRQGR